MKLEVIFGGICVHDLCFFAFYENGQLFVVDSACYVVRCSLRLHLLWYGFFSTGAFMVVCRAMELDGDKRVQLVQVQTDKAK